jgi:hypothetical protein
MTVVNNEIALGLSFGYLWAPDLIQMCYVNKQWQRIAEDPQIWRDLIDKVWAGKVYIPRFALMVKDESPKAAFYLSVIDSQRNFMTKEEMSLFLWNFRFKSTAGEEWVNACQWNRGDKASNVRFQPNGVLQRYAQDDTMQEVYDHLSLQWSLRPLTRQFLRKHNPLLKYVNIIEAFAKDVPFKRSSNQANFHGIESAAAPGSPFKTPRSSSKFSMEEFKDLINVIIDRELTGEAMVLQVNEVSVPTYVISRSPIGNWGFMLENCWAIYFSWEIPVKGQCLELEDDALKVRPEQQWNEVRQYNRQIVNTFFP